MTTTATLPRTPIRSWTGIELPTAGRWSLHRASFVGVGLPGARRRLTRTRMLDGWIDVGDAMADPLAIELRVDHSSTPRLLAWAGSVAADGNGFAREPLDGEIRDLDDAPLDVMGEMVFHGAYRRGTETWAWLSGSVSTRLRPVGPPDRWRWSSI